MPSIGDISRRDKEGLRGLSKIIWMACAGCGKERWVFLKTPNVLCRVCGGKKACKRPEFTNAKHKDDCECQRCRTEKGELTRERNPAWKGGVTRHATGYVLIRLEKDDPNFCMTHRGDTVMEHRLVMARHLGRPLERSETVHHKNGDRTDNRIENLELWYTNHGHGMRVEDIVHQYAHLFGYVKKEEM